MKEIKTTTAVALTLALAAPAWADDVAQETKASSAMEEVVVTASRIDEPIKQVSAAIQVIDADEIASTPARTVGDLLAAKGLGSIKHYPGGLTAVDIRGFKSESYGNDLKAHVLVLLNGRRAGTANVAKLMTDNVERIEIIRGPGSVQYGSAAMGGVINIITRRGSGAPSAEVGGLIGSHGFAKGLFRTAGQLTNVDFSGSFARRSMDDYETGGGDRFHNTGYDIDSYSMTAGYTFAENNRVGAIFNRYDGSDIGNGGYISKNDLDNSKDASNHSFDLLYDGAQGRVSWQLRYFSGKDKDTWHDPMGSNASGWDDGIDYWNHSDFDGAQAQASTEIGFVRLTAGIDWLDYESRSSTDPARSDYENYAGFLLAQAKFLDERLILNAGMRHDTYEVEVVEPAGNTEEDTNLTSTVGLVYLLDHGFKLRAHYGEAFIMPGANELAADFYSDWGSHYIGNPDLDPESSKTVEAGIDFARNGLAAGIGYFHTRFKDKIETVSLGWDQTWENIGKAEISGVEGELSWDVGAVFGWSLEVRPYLNVVWLDRFEDLDNNEELKYISELNASYGISINDYQGLSARLNFTYKGEQTIDDWEAGYPAPVISYGGFTVADLSISKKVLDLRDKGSLTITGEITNLLDREYAYVKGYPMPGRMVFAGLTYTY